MGRGHIGGGIECCFYPRQLAPRGHDAQQRLPRSRPVSAQETCGGRAAGFDHADELAQGVVVSSQRPEAAQCDFHPRQATRGKQAVALFPRCACEDDGECVARRRATLARDGFFPEPRGREDVVLRGMKIWGDYSIGYVRDCNWLQHYENVVDPWHLIILHQMISGDQFQGALMQGFPTINFEKTARGGTRIVALLDDAYFGLFYHLGAASMTESLFGRLANLHPNLLAVKLDGATKELFVWGLRCGFITFGPGKVEGASEVLDVLDAKTRGDIRAVVSNAPQLSQTLVEKALSTSTIDQERAEKREATVFSRPLIRSW